MRSYKDFRTYKYCPLQGAYVGLKNLGATCYVNTFLQVSIANNVEPGIGYRYYQVEAKTKWPLFCRQHFQMHSIKISLKFVSKDQVNNIPALVQIMAWRRLGDKSLSQPMVVGLLMHICITRPQWVKVIYSGLVMAALCQPIPYIMHNRHEQGPVQLKAGSSWLLPPGTTVL